MPNIIFECNIYSCMLLETLSSWDKSLFPAVFDLTFFIHTMNREWKRTEFSTEVVEF